MLDHLQYFQQVVAKGLKNLLRPLEVISRMIRQVHMLGQILSSVVFIPIVAKEVKLELVGLRIRVIPRIEIR